MKLSGEQLIPIPPAEVYAALNDPEVLQASIPGCQSLSKRSDTKMVAAVKIKIGVIQASFKGEVELSDLDPPNGYTISGKGSAGPAGFASGQARVRLEPHEGGTKLSYQVDTKIGGKFAQIGSRLLESTARKLSKQFFVKFAEQVGGEPALPAEEPAVLTRNSKRMVAAALILAATVVAMIFFLT